MEPNNQILQGSDTNFGIAQKRKKRSYFTKKCTIVKTTHCRSDLRMKRYISRTKRSCGGIDNVVYDLSELPSGSVCDPHVLSPTEAPTWPLNPCQEAGGSARRLCKTVARVVC